MGFNSGFKGLKAFEMGQAWHKHWSFVVWIFFHFR